MGLDEPSGWRCVVTRGALRARIVSTFTAELQPGLETITVSFVPELERLLDRGLEREPADLGLLNDFLAQPFGDLTLRP